MLPYVAPLVERSGTRSRRCLLFAAALLALPAPSGCTWLRREPLAPSNHMRSETTDSIPTGMDDRARQIESNLGVR